MAAESRGARWALLRLSPSGRLALATIGLFAIAALLAPVLTPYQPSQILDMVYLKNAPPSLAHPFGTDHFSHDVFSRMLFGARISLSIATLAVALSATVGTTYGVIAGYTGGWLDAIMMRFIDAVLSIPRVLLLIAILALWSPVPLLLLIVLIGLTGWLEVARIVRAQTMTLRDREFVVAARSLGAGPTRILARHILPNVLSPVIIASTLAIGNVILLEAGLSYLGIGTREPTASWGTMFQDASVQFGTAWWPVVFPGVAIVVIVLAFNAVGDALRELLDTRQLPGRASRVHSESPHG